MDVTETNATATTRRAWGLLAFAGAVLVALSIWAFTEDTSPVRTEAGVRVSPRDAYNPVAAGERLPDGFRQLLPRDAIKPVYDPTFVSAESIAWPAATGTAKGMLGLMMMGTMAVVIGIIGHFVGAGLDPGLGSEQNFMVFTGFRRVGVAMYLTGIALGLSTIITVLRFQATRIREVAAAHGHDH